MNKATVFVVILVIIAVGAVVYTKLGVSGKNSLPQDEHMTQTDTSHDTDDRMTSDSNMMDVDGDGAMEEVPKDTMAGSDTTPASGDVMKPADAAGSSSAQATASVKSFTVTGQNFSFSPSQITVNKGDTVKITFKNSGGFHDLMIDAFNVATKQIGSGAEETVQFVADKTGSFEYYCSVGSHRAMGMKGTLVVQ